MAAPSLEARIKDRAATRLVYEADEELRRHVALFQTLPELGALLDALPDICVVLNGKRQIIFANRWLLECIGSQSSEPLLGARPGEILDCSHAWEESSPGCGATESCQACGALKSVRLCEEEIENTQECRILHSSTGVALDLRISARPLHVQGELFTLLVLKDIGHEKRRQALERLFFHDMLNLTASIMGYAELLERVRPDEVSEMSQLIARMIAELAGEIRAQRDLMLAEREDLKVQWVPVNSRRILTEAIKACPGRESGGNVIIDPLTVDSTFQSDRSLLSRVLGNLIKNALEASPEGHDVTVGCAAGPDWIEFWVHNHGAMPREVQLQVFQRSFSTKGPGRGLGTYSIRLLTERYLHGTVTFTSSPQKGTQFAVRYPLSADGTPPKLATAPRADTES